MAPVSAIVLIMLEGGPIKDKLGDEDVKSIVFNDKFCLTCLTVLICFTLIGSPRSHVDDGGVRFLRS